MKASTIIMTPDVLQAKSLWRKGKGKKPKKHPLPVKSRQALSFKRKGGEM